MSVIDHIKEESELKGKLEERTAIVEKMLKKHMDITEISSITELSVAEIEKLKKKLH